MKVTEIGTDCGRYKKDIALNNLIEMNDVTFGYAPHKPILENISIKIRKGMFVGLLGPSGSGKSTLLKIIVGLQKPWKGTIRILDNNTNTNSKQYSARSIGYVPQVENVDWNFPVTVKEVVGMGIWDRSGVTPWFSKDVDTMVGAILEDLEIYDSEFRNRQIRELSGGEQQRVFLARALIRKPTILVLDEPISGVDYRTRQKIMKILHSLNHDLDMTIIMTTHDLMGVGKQLPWVICMNKRIIAEGDPSTIFTKDNLLRTYGLADYDVSILSTEGSIDGSNTGYSDSFTSPSKDALHIPDRLKTRNDDGEVDVDE